MNEQKAIKIIEQCLNEMYKASTPPISWGQIKKKHEGKKVEFFLKHKLTEVDYDKIKEKYKKKLPKLYRRSLDWILLDYSPTIK
jgi:hypothetical protein